MVDIMRIYVCVKHVPDTAATITLLDPTHIDENITFIINPYDENAIEAAANVKRSCGEAEIIAVTLGKEAAENTLRSALAMGADRGIRVVTDEIPDSIGTARALHAAISKDGRPDLIFAGKEAIDSEGMQTMYRLAVAFGMPVVSNAVELTLKPDGVRVACEMEAGRRDIFEMPLPCVVGTGKALNRPQYPTLPAIMQARKKTIKRCTLQDLELPPADASMELLKLKPAVEARQGRKLTGQPSEIAARLLEILRNEAKVIEGGQDSHG
jgi:electron transfer flavoprotein beta subunit